MSNDKEKAGRAQLNLMLPIDGRAPSKVSSAPLEKRAIKSALMADLEKLGLRKK